MYQKAWNIYLRLNSEQWNKIRDWSKSYESFNFMILANLWCCLYLVNLIPWKKWQTNERKKEMQTNMKNSSRDMPPPNTGQVTFKLRRFLKYICYLRYLCYRYRYRILQLFRDWRGRLILLRRRLPHGICVGPRKCFQPLLGVFVQFLGGWGCNRFSQDAEATGHSRYIGRGTVTDIGVLA